MSSLGDYTNKGSFGQAFKAAHATGGSGHTFSYNNKLYTTNCADGGDYRQKMDDRSAATHKMHQWGHEANSALKNNGCGRLDWMPKVGTDFGMHPTKKNWPANVDDQRALYHQNEYNKKTNK